MLYNGIGTGLKNISKEQPLRATLKLRMHSKIFQRA